jgi:acetolactate synthase-1/2/3 large subunit
VDSGLGFPNFETIAKGNNLPYLRIDRLKELTRVNDFLKASGPGFIEVIIDPDHGFQPKLGSYQKDDGTIVSDSLENMSPHIDKALLAKLMGGYDER